MIFVAIILVVIVLVLVLIRFNYIVIDGYVIWWQVEPILRRGVLKNAREYRAILYYVEQVFSSGGFDRTEERALVERLNRLLSDYHAPGK